MYWDDLLGKRKNPQKGGEDFKVESVEFDAAPGCFVCGGRIGLRLMLVGNVRDEESGEQILNMFRYGAELIHTGSIFKRPRVIIGACSGHEPNLHALRTAIRENGDAINQAIVDEAVHITKES